MRTLKNRWFLTATVVGVVGVVGTIGLVAAGSRHQVGYQYPDSTLTLNVQSPAPGMISVQAQAKVMNPVRDCCYWWRAELHQRQADGSMAVVHTVEWDDPAHTTAAKQLATVPLNLAEQLVAVPTGRYSVYVEVRVDDRVEELDGTISPSMTEIGDSKWITVL
jgi:hypothetical protein